MYHSCAVHAGHQNCFSRDLTYRHHERKATNHVLGMECDVPLGITDSDPCRRELCTHAAPTYRGFNPTGGLFNRSAAKSSEACWEGGFSRIGPE
jgi:hypothetical protein